MTGSAIAMSAAAWMRVGCVEYSALNQVEPDGQRLKLGRALQVDQRQEEVVPGPEEVEQADRDDRRPSPAG